MQREAPVWDFDLNGARHEYECSSAAADFLFLQRVALLEAIVAKECSPVRS
jgi:hypothetical protein